MASYAETIKKLQEFMDLAQKESMEKRSGSCDQAYQCGQSKAYGIALRLLKEMDLTND